MIGVKLGSGKNEPSTPEIFKSLIKFLFFMKILWFFYIWSSSLKNFLIFYMVALRKFSSFYPSDGSVSELAWVGVSNLTK